MSFNFGGSSTPGPAPGGGGFNFGSSTPGQPAASNAAPAFGLGGATTPGAPQTPAAPGAPQTPAAPATGFSFGASQPAAAATTSTPAAPVFGSTTPAGPTFGSTTPAAPAFGSTAAPTATPAAGGAPAPTPSFTFGSTAANTPAPGSTLGAPTPAAPTAATPAPPASGFSFGGAATPAAPTAATPAPPAGGFSFGGAATPASGATPAPPAAGAFSLSGSGSNPAAPNFSLTGSTPAASTALATTTSNALAPAAPRGLEVPDFHTEFPNEAIYSDIRRLLAKSTKASEEGREAACELVDSLRCDGGNPKAVGQRLCAPKTLQYTNADQNLRHQLSSTPTVVLPGNVEATLLPDMLREVFRIADDLRISEKDALVLFAEASKEATRAMLEEKLAEGLVDKSLSDDDGPFQPPMFGRNVVQAAKELYFFERQRCLQTILVLVQSRIEAPQKPWGDLIVQATDALLQNKLIDNLVVLVRDWTIIIGGIEQSLARGHQSSMFNTETKKNKHFDMVHLTYAKQERQAAAEALFYLSYHTQFEVAEVANLIDLVKDLSNGINGDGGLPLLDPFRDVPSAYEDRPQVEQPWAPYQNNLPPQKERKHLEWERLLVKKTFETNLPELLRCVSTLCMTVISALDTKQILIDRNTHRGNAFGQGNKLCPPGESSTDGLGPIKDKLKKEAVGDWKRTDICGLLCGAYAMLISTTTSRLLSSPRGSSSPSPSKHLARTFGEFLTAPLWLSSVTFARLCLLPALQRPSTQPESLCDSSEFTLSVLSDFVSSFIDMLSSSGNLPASRAVWKREQEEGLKLQRDMQKEQREFLIWSGNSSKMADDEKPVPSSVDLMDRPDCMDDIIALAVAVASQGPEFAVKFWSPEIDENGAVSLGPSKALKKLKGIIAGDETLCPFYYAFLAALATASCPGITGNGAEVVHSMLSSPTETKVNWDHVLETLRWFFRQFDNSQARRPAPTNVSTQSTRYYYGVSVASNSQEAAKTPKPLPLGQVNTFWILSLLGLIEKAAKCPNARLEILSKQLPIRAENSGAVLGNDSTLNILFSLLTAPMTPELRGAITKSIASLLSMEGMETAKEEDRTKMRDFCSTAWELVESCQVLPIILLDQYPSGDMSRATSGLQFPASSTSLAGSGGTKDSIIPCLKEYAILFEMEHVESHAGVYPSTEGFLRLLNALFSCCCPSTLGQHWRLRTGCGPYMEYVLFWVLPRATGSYNMGKLPFRSRADEARLVALTLQVIESVLIRYTFTTPLNQPGRSILRGQQINYPTAMETLHLLGPQMLAEKIVDTNVSSCTGNGLDDFENKTVSYGQVGQAGPDFNGMQTQGSSQPFQGPTTSSIPAPKSPGFVVLCNILSASGSELLKALAYVLVDSVSASLAVGNESSKLVETFALFKNQPPTSSSAKHAGRNDTISSAMREIQLEGLRPCFEPPLSYSSAVSWQERSAMHALQIMCAAAAREERFYAAVNSPARPLRIVPTVRFDKRPGLASQINVQNVHLARLLDLILASGDLALSIVDYVGHDCSTESLDNWVAMSGLSLMHFVDKMLPSHTNIEATLGRSSNGYKRLSAAIARRLSISFERCESPADSQILSLILSWLLSDLRKGKKVGFAHALFKVPATVDKRTWNATKDCFQAILTVLNDYSFILDTKTSGFAASCFEILTRLCDLQDVSDRESFDQVLYSMERLRSVFFWITKLKFFLGSRGWNEPSTLQSAVASCNSNVIHSMAWFLKGVASEINMLSGFSPPATETNSLVGYMAPRLGERDVLLSFLFGEAISNVVKDLPIERLTVDDSGRMPPQNAIRHCMKKLQGSAEVTNGYQVVDETLLLERASDQYGKDQIDAFQKWTQSWNRAVKLDCAATHLSDVLRSLVGISLASYDSERAISSDALAVLLTSILARLVSVSGVSQLSPTATNNLGLMTSLLAQQIVYPGMSNTIQVADLRRIRDMLAKAVVASGKHPSGQDASRHQERTGILSASLVEVMQVIPADETEIDHTLFLGVANTLARLSAVVVPGKSAAAMMPTEAALIARSSLGTLVQIWDQEIKVPAHSLAYAFLNQAAEGASRTNARVFLDLLSSLDDGIATLLEELLHVPFVGDVLLQQGLVQSLSNAADKYVQEERRLQQSCSRQSTGHNVSIGLGFPPCLLKHLHVFRVLMATTEYLSEAHVNELPSCFFRVMGKYTHVIERSFSSFSSHGEELRVFIQCVAQVATLLTDTSKSALHSGSPFQPVTTDRISIRDSPMVGLVLNLSLHLAENPVPKDWLANPPHSLTVEKTVTSSVVPISEAVGCMWWERFQNVKRRSIACNFEEWTEEMFKHAMLGVDLLKSGIVVLMNLPPKDFKVELSFVRGLFLLSKAAQTVETDFLARDSTQMNFMDTDTVEALPASKRSEYLRRYGRSLSGCIQRYLLLLVNRAKMFQEEPENRLTGSGVKYCKAIADTLDHTELESQGIPCSMGPDEEWRAKTLAAALRKSITT